MGERSMVNIEMDVKFDFKEIQEREERLAPGHRMCAGCGGTIAVRNVLKALHPGDRAVVGNATGCLEVSTYMYPYTAYEDSYIHSAFENAGAALSGVEAAYNALKKRGKIKEEYKFITFGGDGGTYDIGLQSLSGAMERGHDMVYVCYDNGAYMNTGPSALRPRLLLRILPQRLRGKSRPGSPRPGRIWRRLWRPIISRTWGRRLLLGI